MIVNTTDDVQPKVLHRVVIWWELCVHQMKTRLGYSVLRFEVDCTQL
jgi:hypothetical protein